jgi:SAM-dependent methyltransferase
LRAAFLLGLIFGIALGPCTFAFMAPVLGVVFKAAKTAAVYAGSLLLAYGLGHCAVIVVAGTSTELVQRFLNWNEQSRGVTVVKGVCGVLVIVGGALLIYSAGETLGPMKLRESGMPEEAYWETLLDVPLILDRLGVNSRLRNVIEFGCGYGTFTIPVAQRIAGRLATFDIDPAMVERTRQRAAAAGAYNVRYVVRDVFADGFGGEAGGAHACLLFNILHCEEPERLLAEAARVVRPGGEVLVTHWRCDPATPRGPSMEIRPRPEQIIEWAGAAGQLEAVGTVIDLPPWHYGLRLRRRGAARRFFDE